MTETPAEDKCRLKFEDWMSDGGEWPGMIEMVNGRYHLSVTNNNWDMWQAAWKAAKETR